MYPTDVLSTAIFQKPRSVPQKQPVLRQRKASSRAAAAESTVALPAGQARGTPNIDTAQDLALKRLTQIAFTTCKRAGSAAPEPGDAQVGAERRHGARLFHEVHLCGSVRARRNSSSSA